MVLEQLWACPQHVGLLVLEPVFLAYKIPLLIVAPNPGQVAPLPLTPCAYVPVGEASGGPSVSTCWLLATFTCIVLFWLVGWLVGLRTHKAQTLCCLAKATIWFICMGECSLFTATSGLG